MVGGRRGVRGCGRGGGGRAEATVFADTVGLFFFFPFQVLSVLFTKPTDSTRERERERERESERERQVVLTITK